MNNPTPENCNWVYACPECDRAGQLNEREDGSVICYECNNVVNDKQNLVKRGNRRGENLTAEDKQRFAAEPETRHAVTPNDGTDTTPGPMPKYAHLTPEDLGL